MKILFFFILSIPLFADFLGDKIHSCNQSNYEDCNELGNMYMDKFSSYYNLNRVEYPLKKACNIGRLEKSCSSLARYYFLVKDDFQYKMYLEKSCKMGNDYSCFRLNSEVQKNGS